MHQYSEYGNTNWLQRDHIGGVLALDYKNQEKLSIGSYVWLVRNKASPENQGS